MASKTQIVPKFSFPYTETHVNDNTVQQPRTNEIYTDPATSHVFIFTSSKGVDNVLVQRRTREEAVSMYGETDYSKYGQPYMNAVAAVTSPHATGYFMRVMPENATYSHKVVNLHYYPDVENRKFYVKLVGADGGSDNNITTPEALEAFAKTTVPTTGVDGCGFKVAPMATFRSVGRGVYGDNYCQRIEINKTYEKNYGLKMYTFGVASREGNYKNIASYVGTATTTNKYSENTFINDILDDTDIGVAPVIIKVSEESLKEVYDAYIAFCAQMADEVLPGATSVAQDKFTVEQKKYNDFANAFFEKYKIQAADVVNASATAIVVPEKLAELKIAWEEAKATGADAEAAAKAEFDAYQTQYLSDVADLRDNYATFAAARDEYQLLIDETLGCREENLPDFDQFDFIYGKKVNSTDSHPFYTPVTTVNATRVTTDVKEGEIIGTVDVSALGENVEEVGSSIADYIASYDADANTKTYPKNGVDYTDLKAAQDNGCSHYVVDNTNTVYLMYIYSEVNAFAEEGEPEEINILKCIEVGEKMRQADSTTTEVTVPLVGKTEELVVFDSTIGIQLSGGSDGYFAKPRVENIMKIDPITNATELVPKQWTFEEEVEVCLNNAFNGTYDRRILTARRIPCDAWFDANYPMSVKQTMGALAVMRADAPCYLDTGIVTSYTSETVQKLIHDFESFDSPLISKNLQHYMVKEPSTGKRVTVTITYFLAQIFGVHYNTVGFEVPLVKANAQLSGHIKNSLTPSIEDYEKDLKEVLYDNNFNYFETVRDNVYQRATQETSQYVVSDLSEESNVITAYVIKRGVEDILNEDLYDFSDPDDRSRITKKVENKYRSWVGQKVKSIDVEFAVSPWEGENSIVHCYLAIVFRGLNKRFILEIDINKRTIDTDTNTRVLTSTSES